MKKQKENKPEISFLQQMSLLPEVLIRRFLGQAVAVIGIIVLTVVLIIYYRTWQFCIGFLIALYVAYMAMDLVWGYYSGKIICRRMLCLKSQVFLKRGRVFVIMQDFGETKTTTDNTKQFYIMTSKKNAKLITPQTIMDIYYNENTPLEAIAWEIVGNQGSM